MSEIKTNLSLIRDEVSHFSPTIVAVSKTKPKTGIIEAYEAEQRIFGENKVQELCEKYESLPKDIEWHMIGHLQSNKVKYIAPFVSLIHGVDSIKLLKEINKQGERNNRKINCLLQIHIAEEETKFGLSEAELLAILSNDLEKEYPFVTIKGLMGMATNTTETTQIKKEFTSLKSLYDSLAPKHKSFSELSMGMSGDYKTALESGSSMIRVGSAIFGKRDYIK